MSKGGRAAAFDLGADALRQVAVANTSKDCVLGGAVALSTPRARVEREEPLLGSRGGRCRIVRGIGQAVARASASAVVSDDDAPFQQFADIAKRRVR